MTLDAGIDINAVLAAAPIAGAEHHAMIGSTNDCALKYASDPAIPLPYLVTAQRQTAGRGRGQNVWWTGKGSLAFSLLVGNEWLENIPMQSRPMIALAVGLAVVDSICHYLPEHAVNIHWPNDVLVGGRKLAGILIESPRPDRMVIGVGINVNNTVADAPADLRDLVITLRDAAQSIHDCTQLLIALLSAMKNTIAVLVRSPADIAARVNAICSQRGETLEVTLNGEIVQGLCLGIAPSGALLLKTSIGVCEIWSTA